jgi:hypothetical protein
MKLMKKILTWILVIIPSFVFSQVRVNGYYRKDGTYVQPHYRSSPNNSIYDNYSTKGNINPYTGAEGTKNSYPTTISNTNIYTEYSNESVSNFYGLQNKTIYYDKNWKVLINKYDAEYYRIIDDNKSTFTDYYITGEKQGEGNFITIDKYDDSNSVMDGKVRWYDKSGRLKMECHFVNGKKKDCSTYSDDKKKPTVSKPDDISMTYFEKRGFEFEESFSLKNDSKRDINEISIRIIYKLENGEVIDYRDLNFKDKIPSGLSKKFTIQSFDQNQSFAYKYGNGYLNSYTLFTVEYQVLNSK